MVSFMYFSGLRILWKRPRVFFTWRRVCFGGLWLFLSGL